MHPTLEAYLATAAFFADIMPENHEILLFDLTKEEYPLAAQYHLKKKHLAPVRKWVKELMKLPNIVERGMITRRAEVLNEDRLCMLSALFLKDGDGKPVGALVICMAMFDLMATSAYLDELLHVNTDDLSELSSLPKAEGEPEELTLGLIDQMTEKFTADPERMTPDERMELIIDLYDTGVFELKGAVSRAAFVMNMSEQSVYRYLAKIRRFRGE